ncbi:hypothetical protein A3Q56_08457, partial [Intoshia linei]
MQLSDIILKPKALLNDVEEFNVDVKTWISEFDEYISLIDAKNELSAKQKALLMKSFMGQARQRLDSNVKTERFVAS